MKSRLGAIQASLIMLSLLVASTVNGQGQQPMRQGESNIALVDVSYLFKETPRLKARLEDLRGQAAKAQAAFEKDREQLQTMAEDLKNLTKGSPEYKAQEEKLVKMDSQLQVNGKLQQREFQQLRARMFYESFQEIYALTDSYCQQHNIDLVLQFDGEKPDFEQPNSVMGCITKTVVWYRKPLDITPLIAEQLRGPAQPATAARPNNNYPQPSQPNAQPNNRQGVPFTR
jgi:Skp family chaperone for outer membrane proteins